MQENDTAEHTTTLTFLTTKRAQENTQTAHPVRTKNATKMRTAKTHGKASKAARYIKNNPKIGATELAKKSEISVTYARKLLAEKRAQNDGAND